MKLQPLEVKGSEGLLPSEEFKLAKKTQDLLKMKGKEAAEVQDQEDHAGKYYTLLGRLVIYAFIISIPTLPILGEWACSEADVVRHCQQELKLDLDLDLDRYILRCDGMECEMMDSIWTTRTRTPTPTPPTIWSDLPEPTGPGLPEPTGPDLPEPTGPDLPEPTGSMDLLVHVPDLPEPGHKWKVFAKVPGQDPPCCYNEQGGHFGLDDDVCFAEHNTGRRNPCRVGPRYPEVKMVDNNCEFTLKDVDEQDAGCYQFFMPHNSKQPLYHKCVELDDICPYSVKYSCKVRMWQIQMVCVWFGMSSVAVFLKWDRIRLGC